MNTTPILAAAALLACCIPTFSQNDPFGDSPERVRPKPHPAKAADPFGADDPGARGVPKPAHEPEDPFAPPPRKPHDQALLQRIEVHFEDTPLPDVVEYLQGISDNPLNFVVRPPAEEVIIPRMKIRDVSIETVLEVIEGLTPVQISTIRGNDHGAPVIVIQARESMRSMFGSTGTTAHPLAPGSQPAGARLTQRPRSSQVPLYSRVIDPKATPPAFTRAYAVREILETIELEALIDLIQKFWSRSEPNWSKESAEKAIALHEATGMLIVKAPEPRQEEIRSLLDGLGSSIKAAQPDPEVIKLQGRLVELEHRAQLAMQTAEDQRARNKDTEAMLREVIGQRDHEVIELQRTVTELKDSLERAKTRK